MSEMGDLDPQMRDFVRSADRLFTPEYDALPIAEQRRLYDAWCAEWSAPRSTDIMTADFLVPTAGHAVPVRLYRRRNLAEKLPVILYIHGGGWILGNLDTHDQVTDRMALETDAAVLSIDYRLSPEHRFPTALDDCYGVLVWLMENGAALGLNIEKVAVAGDSAGGNLAVAVALAARDRQGPKIIFQALIYPALTFCRKLSAEADGSASNTSPTDIYAKAYLARPEDAQLPLASPLLAESFADLPPAYLAAAALDPIREDAEIYAQKLQSANIPVTYRSAPGLPHTYLRAIHCCAAASEEFSALCQALRHALA